MLPIHISEAVKRQVLHYIGATFEFRSKEADLALTRFITDPEKGLFKGPWVQIQRPFTQAPTNAKAPFDINVSFHPFKHQQIAWQRLTTKDGNPPKHTIVTTGTGSGKTECFLYPVLDYVLKAKQAGKEGIKAIILYPMNALASDQERRFAKEVYRDKKLKGAGVRIGLFTGRDLGDSKKTTGHKEMGEDHGITNQDALRDTPPDVLLTNYKMLDFLLMRPKDAPLWRFNEPGILQYLILDELHTYDGAQGADVACLIRRLKEKLRIPRGEICVVGTSATIDEGPKSDRELGVGVADQQESASDVLREFAGKLFEEDIEEDALIGEDRIPTDKIINFETLDESTLRFPDAEAAKPKEGEDALEFAMCQAALWGAPAANSDAAGKFESLIDRYVLEDLRSKGPEEVSHICFELALGEWLTQHPLFARLLQVSERAELESLPLEFSSLVDRTLKESINLAADFGGLSADDRETIFASFFALIAHAKELRSKRPFPLISVRVQLWMRELRRLGRVVEDPVRFRWLEEVSKETNALPAFHCALCGDTGWVALKNSDSKTSVQSKGVDGFELETDPGKIYRASIGYKGKKDQRLIYFSRYKEGADDPAEVELKQQKTASDEYYIHPGSLVIRRGRGECPLSGEKYSFRIKVNERTKKEGTVFVGDQGCPHCGEREGMFFIGARGAVLSSVAIDEMYGSPLNSDPKLLAFTDSVQDASHRAGFFSARTYHFTFRTALQHLVDDTPEGLPLAAVGQRLLDFWTSSALYGGGSMRSAIESLLPPDLKENGDYLAFRESDATTPGPKLRDDIAKRLSWEAASEFGVLQTHGRTLERMGSAALGWDAEILSKTVDQLKNALPGIAESLDKTTKEQLTIWILGILHRYRERGVLDHPFMDHYVERTWWGKTCKGYTPPEREFFPPGSRYVPGFLVTQPKKGAAFHHITAASQGRSIAPWPIRWTRRALSYQDEELCLTDLLEKFLKVGAETGLLRKLKEESGRAFYTISADAARLQTDVQLLRCSVTGKYIVRPTAEAKLWEGAPSIEYYGEFGRYAIAGFDQRHEYYRARYRKGALRRVVAQEHTGLLQTEKREQLERDFIKGSHRDDPNVLTCTSTLEMGIDIGDLSSTMLCSIPPSTANYLQRIGRAGRQTGSSFVISVVNQRPHDLFFFARPQELLKGKIDTPGCWLDASAVLFRQYFGFCFDCASAEGVLKDFPLGAKSLYEDEKNPAGMFRTFMRWVDEHEEELQSRFLSRFSKGRPREVQDNTRERFLMASQTADIANRVHEALVSFSSEFKSIEEAIAALNKRLSENQLTDDDKKEIERERSVLKGRLKSYQFIGSYQLLCDHGLLPNYAFPDRGVRFFGSVYNQNQRKLDTSIELVRSASAALKELAPLNSFYTHGRSFEIQRIAVGNSQESLVQEFGVCGHCGFIAAELAAGSSVRCPQCGRSGSKGPGDLGNRKSFVEFPRSYALSSMEFHESYSGDSAEERDRQYYRVVSSFDQTIESASGAVGEESLPFGIEYRNQLALKEVNTGFYDSETGEHFGPEQEASEEGFRLCKSCGTVVEPGQKKSNVKHPRSCSARKKADDLQKKNKDTDSAFEFISVNLFRELRSEALRLLVPFSAPEELATLSACLELGLKRKFRGSPNHLIIRNQKLPSETNELGKNFLVMLDGVPGGTGYLKALYETTDSNGVQAEGVIEIMRLALQALETCSCRRPPKSEDEEDTDGCYRCIRSYHLQYRAGEISRSLGVRLLKTLISAAKDRVVKEDLTALTSNSLFESELEQRFISQLRCFAEENDGSLKTVMVQGRQGFRLEIGDQVWDIELQRSLNEKDGVIKATRPDFIFWPQDSRQRAVAIYTDGKEYHLFPKEGPNRLADDFEKRRAVLESGSFWVWSLSWDDLENKEVDCDFAFPRVFDGRLGFLTKGLPAASRNVINSANRNPFSQLCAYLTYPSEKLWRAIGEELVRLYLGSIELQQFAEKQSFENSFWNWREGNDFEYKEAADNVDFCFNNSLVSSGDLLVFRTVEGIESTTSESLRLAFRLPSQEEIVRSNGFTARWRAALACLNLYQFQPEFRFWATTEVANNTAPDPDLFFIRDRSIAEDWGKVISESLSTLRSDLEELAIREFAVPQVAFHDPAVHGEAEAELFWSSASGKQVVVLVGDQMEFSEKWEARNYVVYEREMFHQLVEERREHEIANYLEQR